MISGAFLDDGAVHDGLEIVDDAGGKHLLVVRNPIVNLDYETDSEIEGDWKSSAKISELMIRKNLPEATRLALESLTAQG